MRHNINGRGAWTKTGIQTEVSLRIFSNKDQHGTVTTACFGYFSNI